MSRARVLWDYMTLWRQVPTKWLLFLLAPCLFLFLMSWAFSSPAGSAIDDDFHMTSYWCATNPAGPECDDSGGLKLVPQDVALASCYKWNGYTSGACTLVLKKTPLTPARYNQGSYPSGYYRVANLFVDHSNVDLTVLLVRGFNSLLATLLITAAIALTANGLRRAVAITWLLGLGPLTAFFIASDNPTSWAIIGIGTFWAFVLRYLEDPDAKGIASGVLALVAAGLATESRTDTPAFLAVVLAACLGLMLPGWRGLAQRRYWPIYVLAAGVIVRFASRPFGLSVLKQGMGATQGTKFNTGFALFDYNIVHVFSRFLPGIFSWNPTGGTRWGLGWIDTPMPYVVGVIGCGLVVALFWASREAYWRRKAWVVAFLALVLVAVPLFILQQSHAQVGQEVEPRYLLPLALVLVGVVATTGVNGYADDWYLRPWMVGVALLGTVVANFWALHVEIRRYVTGLGPQHLNLDWQQQWWWPHFGTPMLVWVVGGVIAIGVFATLGAIAYGSQDVVVDED